MGSPVVHWYEPADQPHPGEVTLTLCGRSGDRNRRGWYAATHDDIAEVTCKRCNALLAKQFAAHWPENPPG